MRLFKGFICTDKIGSDCEFEFEIEDEYTEYQIEGIAKEVAFNHISWYFVEIR